MKYKLLLGLLALCSFCTAEEEGDPRSLAGIKAVYVMVDSSHVSGLSNDIVKTEVEAQLRSFGITVGKPPILLRVSYFGAPGVMYGVFVNVSQRVALIADSPGIDHSFSRETDQHCPLGDQRGRSEATLAFSFCPRVIGMARETSDLPRSRSGA